VSIALQYLFVTNTPTVIGSHAASFKRPFLSVDVSVCDSVCVSATLMLNISENKRFRGSCPIGSLGKCPRRVDRWRNRDYDVILATF